MLDELRASRFSQIDSARKTDEDPLRVDLRERLTTLFTTNPDKEFTIEEITEAVGRRVMDGLTRKILWSDLMDDPDVGKEGLIEFTIGRDFKYIRR